MAQAVNSITMPASRRYRRRPWHQFRPEIEALIERLVTILDEVDGDPDLEPSLAAPELRPRDLHPMGSIGPDGASSQIGWAAGSREDFEQDAGDDPEEPGALIYWGEAEPDAVRVRRATR